MAFRSPSDGALISPYQQIFGSPGQTKVSGDRQRETTHKIYCYESQLIFYLENFRQITMPVIMYFLKPSLPSWKTSRHCTVLLHTRREAETVRGLSRVNIPMSHTSRGLSLYYTSKSLKKAVCAAASQCVIELVMDFLELSMSFVNNLSNITKTKPSYSSQYQLNILRAK